MSAYFLYFAIPAIRAGFAPDDPMNMGFYWLRGFWPSVADMIRFWSTAYRPMGALFYMPIYHVFGIEPVPYRIAVLALIAAHIYLGYRLMDLLTGSKAGAALTAMLVAVHASMVPIYYNTSQIYDILAFFFLALMLVCYISCRRHGQALSIWQSAVVLCAFAAALDSKELAVVASGWVLAYELLFHRPWRLRLPILLVIISLVYTLGKFLGSDPLYKASGYLLEPTLHRYMVNNRWYVNDLFYSHYFDTSRKLVFAWCVLTAICWIARKRELWWCWFAVSTATLGISFTLRPRGGPGLYIPLLAWAMLASVLATSFLKKRPLLEWSAVAIVALIAGHYTVGYWRPQAPLYVRDHRLTGSVIAQIRGIQPKPAPGSRVIILKNPLDDYYAYFIASLIWNDHTITIHLANKLAEPPDLASYQWILTFEGDKLQVLKKPG